MLSNFAPLLIIAGLWCVYYFFAVRKQKPGAEAPRVNSAVLENVVPLAAYEVDETGYWGRMGWFYGLTVGIGLALVGLLPFENLLLPPAIRALIGFTCGLLSGPLFKMFVRQTWRRNLAGLYAGDAWIVEPPPAAGLYYYRIPCSLARGTQGVQGVLYLGRGGVLFIPSKLERKHRAPLDITPLSEVNAALREPSPQTGLQRWLVPRPLRQIEFTWDGKSVRFFMPRPAETIKEISRRLELLQRIPQAE